jgi:transcriptional regulator with XRE-family HTH domain
MTNDKPNAETQRLAETLRQLRESSGISGRELARRTYISQGKISRIECGDYVPTLLDVEAVGRALSLDPETVTKLATMVRRARTEHQSSRQMAQIGWEHRQRMLIDLDSSSRHVRQFLPSMLGALLQTPEYSYASCDSPISMGNWDAAEVSVSKLSRQRVLDNAEVQFTFLLTVAAATWPLIDPEQMARQHRHLIELSQHPNVTIRIIDSESRLVRDGPLNTFTVFDDRLVACELFSGEVTLTDPADVTYHRQLFDYFLSVSRSEVESREWIAGLCISCT